MTAWPHAPINIFSAAGFASSHLPAGPLQLRSLLRAPSFPFHSLFVFCLFFSPLLSTFSYYTFSALMLLCYECRSLRTGPTCDEVFEPPMHWRPSGSICHALPFLRASPQSPQVQSRSRFPIDRSTRQPSSLEIRTSSRHRFDIQAFPQRQKK